jgi:integrase
MRGNLARSTLHLHLVTLAKLGQSLGWDRHIGRITSRDIELFRAQRLQAGLSAASANKEVKTLRRIMNLAATRGYLKQSDNPCLAIPMLKVGRKRPPYCSPQEFAQMYAAASDPMWRALLVVLYSTGLRLREAINLTWSDIDFACGQLHVARKDASGLVQAWTPKDHEMRSIPLPEQAVNLLTQWQSAAPVGCPYVFMDHGRWAYYRQEVQAGRWRAGQDLVNNMLRKYRTICRRAGVEPYTIHDLRRSCITNWARKLPIHVAQQLAGHSDIKTTQQFYLSVGVDDVTSAQRVQAAILTALPAATGTDPKLTHWGQRRAFPGRRVFTPCSEVSAS